MASMRRETRVVEVMKNAQALHQKGDAAGATALYRGILPDLQKLGETNARFANAAADVARRTAAADAAASSSSAGSQHSFLVERPTVSWDDVAGLEEAKRALREAVVLPTQFPHLFSDDTGRAPWRGVLLYGPPGTGKSFLAKAVANSSRASYISVSPADLVSKWQGDSEKAVSSLFEAAVKFAPAVIFIDEVDALTGTRAEGEADSTRRIKTQLLLGMDSVTGKRVLVLAASNTPWTLDPAFRRRFEKRIYIPLPDREARETMLRSLLKRSLHSLSDTDVSLVAEATDGLSGADVAILVRTALMQPVRRLAAATFFSVDAGGGFTAVDYDPPCPRCPMRLSGDAMGTMESRTCASCGCVRTSLASGEIPPEGVRNPVTTMEDFTSALAVTKASVASDDLNRFTEWTVEYGVTG